MHPMILGELACGRLSHREQLISLWRDLPQAIEASHNEVLSFLNQHNLMGRGIGWVDMHLLASVLLSGRALLWSRDKRLSTVAEELSLQFSTV